MQTITKAFPKGNLQKPKLPWLRDIPGERCSERLREYFRRIELAFPKPTLDDDPDDEAKKEYFAACDRREQILERHFKADELLHSEWAIQAERKLRLKIVNPPKEPELSEFESRDAY
ncbi:MAG TPA: hypothetical protein VKX25_14285 [Bryobacteraceae bacterium]|jgi:hypothetical protein|nr:hypothetical protein [Bryobacteraceae bacterium]